MKLPSTPESMSTEQETEKPAHRRTAGKVVRVFGGEERTVALASTPLSTDELWLLTDTKRQSGQPHHNKDRDD